MNQENHIRAYKRVAPNFMTPDVVEYVMTTDNRIIELSTGTDMQQKKIWGVTEFDTDLKTTRKGQMHRSAKSARTHFNSLFNNLTQN